METEKRYTLVLYKSETSERYHGDSITFDSCFEVAYGLTKGEAFAFILKHEVEKDPHDIPSYYYLFDDSPDRSNTFFWEDRLRQEVPEKRRQYKEERKQANIKKEQELRAVLQTNERERETYERLKAKFEGSQKKSAPKVQGADDDYGSSDIRDHGDL